MMSNSTHLENSLKREKAKVQELEKIIEDKTRELYQRQQEYEEKSLLLKNITNTMPDGLLRFDQDGIIDFTNQAFLSLSKYYSDQVISRHISNFLEPVYENKKSWLEDILRNPPSFTMDFYLKSSDDEKIYVLLTASTAQENERNEKFITVVVKDYREVKELQEQVLLSQKLDSIGILASGVAHEINTPMQYVIDNLDYIQMVWPKIENYIKHLEKNPSEKTTQEKDQLAIEKILPEIPEAIKHGFKGAKIVTNIIRSMKKFASSDSEKAQRYDIHKGLEDIILMTKNEWKYVANLKTDFDSNINTCYCYLNELNQVMLNLIINAVHSIQEKNKKSNREKGEITVSTKLEEGAITLSVSDNGIGIPEKNKEKLFDPFFSTKPPGKGSGQGLSIAYRIIVEKHRGKIYTTSSGKLTIFHVQIPINLNEL